MFVRVTITPSTCTWYQTVNGETHLYIGEVERCETCGAICQKPNAVQVSDPGSPLLDGVHHRMNAPMEQFVVDEDTGRCGCDRCYGEPR